MEATTTTHSSPHTDPAGADPRATFAEAAALGGRVIATVRQDQLGDPTPCTDWNVRELLDHLVSIPERVAQLGRGENPFTGVMDDGATEGTAWLDTWLAGVRAVQEAWSDDATLDRVVTLPWAQLSGAATLASYTAEVTVHTWDVATATGQRPQWDQHVLAVALEAIMAVLPAGDRCGQFEAVRAQLPEEMRGFSAPFAEAIDVPADAPLIDRLVAWNGRQP